jgi:hypothetical protein
LGSVPDGRDEILTLIASNPDCDACYIPRRNYFTGRWIKGSGWYPNHRQAQLCRKGSMRYTRTIYEEVDWCAAANDTSALRDSRRAGHGRDATVRLFRAAPGRGQWNPPDSDQS